MSRKSVLAASAGVVISLGVLSPAQASCDETGCNPGDTDPVSVAECIAGAVLGDGGSAKHCLLRP